MVRNVLFAVAIAVASLVSAPSTSLAGSPCGVVVECCIPAPPPVAIDLCVVDPCTGKSGTFRVCVPAECACEKPCLVGWKRGFLGRKVLTYKWPCGYCLEVVITPFGRVII